MGEEQPGNMTQMLAAAKDGDPLAAERLLPLVYEELRKLAHHRMNNEPPGQTLTATALVHEAYLRLLGDDEVHWDSRGHFFAAAGTAMRRIMVERARKRGRAKHGGDRQREVLGDVAIISLAPPADLLALDEALTKLERQDRRRNDVVLLRYFAGLTVEETARALGISPRTVKSEWSFARAWLHRELGGGENGRAL